MTRPASSDGPDRDRASSLDRALAHRIEAQPLDLASPVDDQQFVHVVGGGEAAVLPRVVVRGDDLKDPSLPALESATSSTG